MENQSEAKKEYDLKKQERLEKREAVSKESKRKGSSKKILGWVIFVIIIILIIFGFRKIVENNTPKGDDFSKSFPNSGREHIDIDSAHLLSEDTYSSDPPSSGPHYPNTARPGFYDEVVEDQYAIHNLEHGDIWIAYHPRISEDIKRVLEKFDGPFTLISPREENEFDISLMAWGRVDSFNLTNDVLLEQRMQDFILRYDNKGPEKVRGGGGHQTTSFN